MDYPNSIIMNKALNILAAAIVAAAMTAACGNKTEAPAQDADSTEVADSAAVADSTQAEASEAADKKLTAADIKDGMPLLEVIHKADEVEWQWNEVYYLYVEVCGIQLMVDEDSDLTPAGKKFMEKFYANQETMQGKPLPFKDEYVKPSAKVSIIKAEDFEDE